jgi:hypothetical protein
MCGIVGAIGKDIDLDIVYDLFISTEARGKQATGFWSPATDTIKAPVIATKFLEKQKILKKLKKAVASGMLLGHTRHATHGEPKYNYNNHPIKSENWIIVHNGVVSIKDFDDYEYVSDTDTENILAYIERFGLIEGLAKISSGASVILKKKDEDDCIYVWRTSTGDLLICYDIDNETLYVCSGEKYMKDGVETKYSEPEGFSGLFHQMDRTILLGEPKSRELWKLKYDGEKCSASIVKTIPIENGNTGGCRVLDWRKGQEVKKLTADVGKGKLRPGVIEGRVKPYVPPKNPPVYPGTQPLAGTMGYPNQHRQTMTEVKFHSGDIVELSRDVGPTDAIFSTTGDMVEEMKAGMQFKIRKSLRNDRYAIETKDSEKIYVVEDNMIILAEQPSCLGVMIGSDPDKCEACFYFDTCEVLFREYNFNHDTDKPDCAGSFEAEDEDCMNCEFLAYCIHQTWGNTAVIDADFEVLENAPEREDMD